jgi:hypothetical protein
MQEVAVLTSGRGTQFPRCGTWDAAEALLWWGWGGCGGGGGAGVPCHVCEVGVWMLREKAFTSFAGDM